jgi:hypothetical protein
VDDFVAYVSRCLSCQRAFGWHPFLFVANCFGLKSGLAMTTSHNTNSSQQRSSLGGNHMHIKTIKSGLWAVMLGLGVAGYFTLDWYEGRERYRCETLRLKLERLHESMKNISVGGHQKNQDELRSLESNAGVLHRYLGVLLRQVPENMVLHRFKYDEHDLLIEGEAQSSRAITQLMTNLSAVVLAPVVIRSLSQGPNGKLIFELVTENIGIKS